MSNRQTNSKPRFPLYVVSKGRHEYMITSKALTRMGVEHYIVVEPQQANDYRQSVKAMGLATRVLELDMTFKERYELCDNLGLTKSTGSGPARNFAWEHARAAGHGRYWCIDDNIVRFSRMTDNMRVEARTPLFWIAMEDFVERYTNIAMAGPNYKMFAYAGKMSRLPPYVVNTKLYSCNLIRTDLPMRWRGRYNEDVILAIDILKAGWCTCQFNAFLQQKMVTQALPGGNTTELYNGAEKSAARHTQKTGPPPNRKCLHACTQTLRAWCGSSGACTTT